MFGQNDEKAIRLDGLQPVIVDMHKEGVNDLWVHDEKDKTKANIISRFFDSEFNGAHFPRPFGVIYADERPTYEDKMVGQIEEVKIKKSKTPLGKILSGDKTWTIL